MSKDFKVKQIQSGAYQFDYIYNNIFGMRYKNRYWKYKGTINKKLYFYNIGTTDILIMDTEDMPD